MSSHAFCHTPYLLAMCSSSPHLLYLLAMCSSSHIFKHCFGFLSAFFYGFQIEDGLPKSLMLKQWCPQRKILSASAFGYAHLTLSPTLLSLIYYIILWHMSLSCVNFSRQNVLFYFIHLLVSIAFNGKDSYFKKKKKWKRFIIFD